MDVAKQRLKCKRGVSSVDINRQCTFKMHSYKNTQALENNVEDKKVVHSQKPHSVGMYKF